MLFAVEGSAHYWEPVCSNACRLAIYTPTTLRDQTLAHSVLIIYHPSPLTRWGQEASGSGLTWTSTLGPIWISVTASLMTKAIGQ